MFWIAIINLQEDITGKGEDGESTVLEIPALELVKADDFYGNSVGQYYGSI